MKTDKTVAEYRIRATQLIKNAGQALGSDRPTMHEVAAWLVDKQPSLSRATWRQYRSALLCFFDDQASESASTLADKENAIALLKSTPSSRCRRRGVHTSAKKQKKISEADLKKLIVYFGDNAGIPHGVATFFWLVSGIWTGLRPLEWESAQLIVNAAGDHELHVMNAKNTNKRSHGPGRIVHLSNVEEQELKVIQLHLANVASARDKGMEFEQYYRQCRGCLYKANRKLWPRRPKNICLYSARHQFAADAKKSGLSKTAIAALMGHASQETAATHYGRRTAGRGGFRVTADQADVARVQELHAKRQDAHHDSRPCI
jgi:integrase